MRIKGIDFPDIGKVERRFELVRLEYVGLDEAELEWCYRRPLELKAKREAARNERIGNIAANVLLLDLTVRLCWLPLKLFKKVFKALGN